MGNDHAARNAAKKFKKRQRQDVGRDGKPTRDRKKRKGPRRLCRGVCYNSPVLSEKDKKWNGQPDYEDEEDDVEDKVMEAVVNDASSTKKKKNNKKRKVDDADDNENDDEPRMSTEIKLLDPQILLSQAKAKTLSKLPSGASVAALEPYHPLIQTCMLSQGFVEPTPIQIACWNLAVAGKDVLGVAEPGSGKTLAYLLPGFVKLSNSKTSSSAEPVQDVVQGPRMLVVLPTRELVMQVSTVCRGFRGSTGLRVAHVYGGVPRESQIAQLVTNPDVIIATPGRLLDLFDTGDLRLDNMSYVVLDESDKMLSLGFKPQIERLHNILFGSVKITQEEKSLSAQSPKKVRRESVEDEKKTKAVGGPSTLPQIMLFTATLPEDIVSTSAAWQRSGEDLEVVNITTSSAAVSSTVTQTVHVCAEHKKLAKLLKHLTKIKEQGATLRNPPRVLIFCNRVKAVRFLFDALGKESFRPVMLHGQRSQAEREAAIKDFRSGKAQIMVATDVAARGLDVRALPYVINYDFPSRLETYIHRIGRTGRLAAYGHAYSFFTRNLAKLAKPLQDLLVAHKQKVDPNLISVAEEWLAEEAEMRSATELLKIDASGSLTDDKEKDGEEDEDDELKENASLENVKKTKKKVSLDDESTVASLPEDLLEGLGLPRIEDSNGEQKLTNGKEEGEGLEAGARKKKGMKTVEVLNVHDELVEKPLRVVPKLDLSVDPQSKQQRKKARLLGVDERLVPSKQEPAEENKEVNEAVEDTSSTSKKKKVKEVVGANKNASGSGKDLSTCSIPLVAAFLPAKKFEGSKPGMVFKMDKLGLGYYRDELQMAKLKAQVVAANEPAPSPALKAALKKAEATANAAAAAAAMAIKKAEASVNAGVAVTAKLKSVKKGKDSGEKKEEAVAAISIPPSATAKVVPATSIENAKNKGKENGASSISIAPKKKGLVAPVVNRNKPIVPSHTGDSDYGSDDGSDGDDGWGALAEEAKNLSGIKGEKGENNGKSQKKKNSVKQSDSDSDDDSGANKGRDNKKKKLMKGGGGRVRGGIMKKKAVPGRLRKALAKRSSGV